MKIQDAISILNRAVARNHGGGGTFTDLVIIVTYQKTKQE